MFNGETLWKDGVRTSYGCQAFTALREGDTVGVMKQGSQLHFFVNGQDQGVADGNLSEETGVYALVDLYGRCTKVTIASGGAYVYVCLCMHISCSGLASFPGFTLVLRPLATGKAWERG